MLKQKVSSNYTVYCGQARGRTKTMRQAIIVGKKFAIAANEPGFEVFCEITNKTHWFPHDVRVSNEYSRRTNRVKVIG